MGTSLPFFRPLTDEDVRLIDRTGRRILERIGIKVDDLAWLERLEAAGARVDYDDRRIRFSGDWLDESLSRAPSRFTLYSRDGRNDLHLGEGNVYFANGGRAFRILDMGTGGYRRTMLRDVANTAILVDHLDYIRFYIIACQAHDLEPQTYHLNDFFRAFFHTTKHVMGGCDSQQGAAQMFDLASLIAGGEDRLREKPFVSVITNVVSPLTIDATTLDIVSYVTHRGYPHHLRAGSYRRGNVPCDLGGHSFAVAC